MFLSNQLVGGYFYFCAVTLACSLANFDSAMRMVKSTDLAYYSMLLAILCTQFITSDPAGF